MEPDIKPDIEMNPIAVTPLLGNQQTDEGYWLGALLAKLLAEHLSGTGLPVLEYNEVARHLARSGHSLPLTEETAENISDALGVHVLVHGRYVLDEDGKMLGFNLLVEAPDIPRIPLEASSPIPAFGRFLDRVALAIIDQMGMEIHDTLRQQIAELPRPASFEALRQMARAQLAWAKGQTELALASVTSALSLDADFEEAAALEVAIAREAGDTAATREAFRRWSRIAEKHQRPSLAAERLLALGHWLVERGEWDDARRAYEDARGIFQRASDEEGLALTINDLGNLELLRGNFQNAIQAYRRNLRVFEGRPEHAAESASTFYNLALAHKNLGQYEEAERAIEQALIQARRLNSTLLEARSLAQRGAIFDELGRWARADSDYAQAARLIDVLGDDRALAMIKTHKAILFKHQGAYDRAETLLLEASHLLERENSPYEKAIVWLNLGDLYMSMGLHEQSWEYAERAHEALARLKSGWEVHAQELLDTLKSIPEEEATPLTGEEASFRAPPDSRLFSPFHPPENRDSFGSDSPPDVGAPPNTSADPGNEPPSSD